jgi:hypothetical protein
MKKLLRAVSLIAKKPNVMVLLLLEDRVNSNMLGQLLLGALVQA